MRFLNRLLASTVMSAGVILAGTNPAGALSFNTNGASIVDMDFSASSVASYDGSSQTLTVSTDVDVIRLDNGGSISLAPGQVQLSVQVSRLADVDTDFDSFVQGSFASVGADFVLIDQSDGVIMTGNFIDPTAQGHIGADLRMDAIGGFVYSTILSGEYLAAGTLISSNLLDATGFLSVVMNNLDNPFVWDLLDYGGGLNNFGSDAQADITPNPEPGTALLLGAGLVALGARARRRKVA